jgi:hypothetical protein
VREADFEVDGLTTEESTVEFAKRFLKRTDDAEDQLKEEYDYPRMPVEMVWETASYWAEEINDVPLKSAFAGGKKDISEQLSVEKGNVRFAGEKKRCFKNVKFNGEGYRLYRLVPDDYTGNN